MRGELPPITLRNVAAWAQWLAREAETSKEAWILLARKNVTEPTSLTYDQALDEALCYGWIDGTGRTYDEKTMLRRFTPRTAKSAWSQRNVGHIARLESEGRMQPRGRLEVEKAKADGRWDAAYAGPATIKPPDDFVAAVAAVPEAQAMWDVLTSQNRFAICYRLHSLKTEAGKKKRLEAFVDMLARGETPHPQKQGRGPVVASTRVSKAKASRPATVSKESKSSRITKARPAVVKTASRNDSPPRRSGRLQKTSTPL